MWITLINLVYLLTQMIVAVEDVSVRTAAGQVLEFMRSALREIAAIFGVVLLLVVARDGRVDPGDRRARPDRVRAARRPRGMCRCSSPPG